MKKAIRIFFMLSLTLLTFFSVLTVSASGIEISSADFSEESDYIYPITPVKTPDIWKSFTTHAEMLNACAIPEKNIASMTTKQLLRACADYPLNGDMMCYDSLRQGFKSIIKSFGGLRALLERKDLNSAFTEYYSSLDVKNIILKEEFASKRCFLYALSAWLNDAGMLEETDLRTITAKNSEIDSELKKQSDTEAAGSLTVKNSDMCQSAAKLSKNTISSITYDGSTILYPEGTIYHFNKFFGYYAERSIRLRTLFYK